MARPRRDAIAMLCDATQCYAKLSSAQLSSAKHLLVVQHAREARAQRRELPGEGVHLEGVGVGW